MINDELFKHINRFSRQVLGMPEKSLKQYMRFALADVVYARCKRLKKYSCLTRAITTFSHTFDMTSIRGLPSLGQHLIITLIYPLLIYSNLFILIIMNSQVISNYVAYNIILA